MKKQKTKMPLLKNTFLILLFMFLGLTFTHVVSAQPAVNIPTAPAKAKISGRTTYVSLSGLEKISDDSSSPSLVGYVNIMFTLLITVSTMLAVLFIAIAGVKYMATDLIGVKESAKGDIYSALIGLLLILSSVIILETINPCIVNFNILETGSGTTCNVK